MRGRKIQGKTEFARLVKEKGLSLKEFAEKTGLNYKTIRQWSYGGNPVPKFVFKIIKLL